MVTDGRGGGSGGCEGLLCSEPDIKWGKTSQWVERRSEKPGAILY